MSGRERDFHISAFAWVPERSRGWVKCLRPRWAFEEAGFLYRVTALGPGEGAATEYRAWQPFGQVPAYDDGEVRLFESGAILLRIGELSDRLRGWDASEAGRISSWVFAALNSVEPQVVALNAGHAGADAAAARRFAALEAALEGREWLADRFSVADIALATVLREAGERDELRRHGRLSDYLDRCLARPAFARALKAQFADFDDSLVA